MLNRNKLIRALMLEEKGKSQMKIHDLRQVIADLADWSWEDPRVVHLLLEMGKKRAQRKAHKPGWWRKYISPSTS